MRANPTLHHLVERVVVDPSRYTPGLAGAGMRQPGVAVPSTGRSAAETKAKEVTHGVPDEQPPSIEFSSLQALLCPSPLQCCVPRNATWYSVTVDNLKPISYEKEAMDALVIPRDTKAMLLGLVEEHQRTKSQGAFTDFIANKGEVSPQKCSRRNPTDLLHSSEPDHCPSWASRYWQNIDSRYVLMELLMRHLF